MARHATDLHLTVIFICLVGLMLMIGFALRGQLDAICAHLEIPECSPGGPNEAAATDSTTFLFHSDWYADGSDTVVVLRGSPDSGEEP